MSAFPCSGVSTIVAVFQKKMLTSAAATATASRRPTFSARRRKRGDDSGLTSQSRALGTAGAARGTQ